MTLQINYSTSTGGRRFLSRPTKSSSASTGTYSPSKDDFVKSFYAVLDRWERETSSFSDPDKIRAHPSYAALVTHVNLAFPLIMSELHRRPSFLVWVLVDAFSDRMDAPKMNGNLRKITDAWLSWGVNHGPTG